jgi:DNA mismatch repair protein MutL
MMPIRQLAPDVAAKIAAGEVVERPASVVKELIENSIDAGATQIRVDLAHGGLQLIRVSDNGTGMPADELALALARHATSKVAQVDDLEHLGSLGFRGEALASIAAVADVQLLSRHRDAVEGAQISAHNGVLSDVAVAASPVGSSLTVRNLFSAVPARLKFLKSRNTEVSHCLHLLEQYALAYPEIRFSVSSEGRQVFATPGDGQLTSVLLVMHDVHAVEQMVPIGAAGESGDDPAFPVIGGYASLPGYFKSTRQHLSFFVNRRWVLSRMLSYAVQEAYHSLLLPGRYPVVVVNITLDPSQIDVNVHPAKTEIRFLKENRVYRAVLHAVRAAVLAAAEVPTWEGQHQPAHSDQARPQEMDRVGASSPQESASPPRDNPWQTAAEEEAATGASPISRLWQRHVAPRDHTSGGNCPQAALLPSGDPGGSEAGASIVSTAGNEAPSLPFAGGELLSSLEALPAPAEGGLPALRVIGQLAQSYIVTEGPDGLYLVDQHAAHERILLERMVAALQARTPLSQLVLTPLVLRLAPAEVSALEERREQLERIGFELDVQVGAVAVRAVPQALLKKLSAGSLQELLADLTAPEDVGHTETWEERALANVACKAAIKAGYFLTVSDMREMLAQLAQTRAPYSCCHGRPTTVRFGLNMLERAFGRR